MNNTRDMRIFTGWSNPFGGGRDKDIRKILVLGTLEVLLRVRADMPD
jgi:hypothetical protein